MKIEVLSFVILVSATAAMYFRHRKNNKVFAVFKPLTTGLIILLSLIVYQSVPGTYSAVIILSLILSLVGDVFLISKKYFLHGLSAFLLAHIGFTASFTSLFGFSWNMAPITTLAVISGAYFWFLKKDLGRYAGPVLVYIFAIMMMNWQAINLIYNNLSAVYIAIACGSLLFTFSDAVIAYDKFKKSFKAAELLILSTYWAAIYIFTVSGLYVSG